jgi:hypothetical protein
METMLVLCEEDVERAMNRETRIWLICSNKNDLNADRGLITACRYV